MKEFKQLMEEVGFQISKLNDGTIEKDDFVQAINEIHEYFNTTIIWKEIYIDLRKQEDMASEYS